MIERAGGGQVIGLSIGVIVGCVTILVLIFTGRLVLGPTGVAGALPKDR